jgi:hypothetical protein
MGNLHRLVSWKLIYDSLNDIKLSGNEGHLLLQEIQNKSNFLKHKKSGSVFFSTPR